MNQNDPQELFEYRNSLLELARVVGRRQPLDEADYTLYWKKLQDVNWPIVKEALDELGREMNWFPSVSIIRDRCRVLLEKRRQEAFDNVMKDCDHGTGHWQTEVVDGVERLRKCDHFLAAMFAMEQVGKRMALPPPKDAGGD